MTIDDFTTLPCLHVKLAENLATLKQDILDFLGKPEYAYSSRNNYTKTLPQYLTDLLVSDIPCEVRSCFISVISPSASIPFHNDGIPKFSVNLPLDNCDKVSFVHSDDTVPAELISTVNGANADGTTYNYEIADKFQPTTVINATFNKPTILNVKRFHLDSNDSTAPAVFLCIRFASVQENLAFEILQNV